MERQVSCLGNHESHIVLSSQPLTACHIWQYYHQVINLLNSLFSIFLPARRVALQPAGPHWGWHRPFTPWPPVCQCYGEVHQRAEHSEPPRVDIMHEEDNPDCGRDQCTPGEVEVPQRDWCCEWRDQWGVGAKWPEEIEHDAQVRLGWGQDIEVG